MTDLNTSFSPLILRDKELRQCMELLFFSYRAFTREADQILNAYDFGRAHHRALYFIGRNPGISVNALLGILKITKQSLSRVLRTLVDDEFVRQEQGKKDKRQRLLYLTSHGKRLEEQLAKAQTQFLADAFRETGPEAVDGFRKVLFAMTDKDDRPAINASPSRLIRKES